MSDAAPAPGHRLILELYQSAADVDTVRAAAEFARLLGLTMHCLFVEDEAVLALAELPFAREIHLPSHEWRRVDAQAMAQQLSGIARRTRRLLDDALSAAGMSSELEVLRGDPADCISGVCRFGDIVIVADPGTPAARTAHGLRRLHQAAHASAASVLVLPARRRRPRGPVVAVMANPTDASLDAACRIAAAAGETVVALLPAPLDAAVAGQVAARGAALGLPRERIAVWPAGSTGADDVNAALDALDERLIVTTRPSGTDDALRAAHLSAARDVPVLMIEPPRTMVHDPQDMV